MKTYTVWGAVADKVGAAVTTETAHGTGLQIRKYHSTPSVRYRRAQARAPVRIDHEGDELGHIEHLELWDDKQLIAVATITTDVDLDGDWFWSPTVVYGDQEPIDMVEASLTRTPATVGLRPVRVLDGDLRHRSARERWGRHRSSTIRITSMLQRAADTAAHGGPIRVCTDTRAAPAERSNRHDLEYGRPPGPLRYGAPVRGSVLRVH